MTAHIIQTSPGHVATTTGQAVESSTSPPVLVGLVTAVGLIAHLAQRGIAALEDAILLGIGHPGTCLAAGTEILGRGCNPILRDGLFGITGLGNHG